MDERKWTVDVDGVKHTIVVDYDSPSQRASIRVDGKLAAKPMNAGEDEREIPVGSLRYVVRRLDGDRFDLDVPPEVMIGRPTARSESMRRATGKPPEHKSHLKMWIGYAVLAVVVLSLLAFGARGFQYMRVPWQAYASPDGTYKVKFPVAPTEQQNSVNINGDLWTVESRFAHYKGHFYAVEYLDLNVVVVEKNVDSIMKDFLSGWASSIGGTVESSEKTSLARNTATSFVISLPPGAGAGEKKLPVRARIRGLMATRGRRLFIAWTMTRADDPFSVDIRQFIQSFEISTPPAQLNFEALNERHLAPREERVAPPVEAPVPDTAAEARRAAEMAARLAAEPQIYLEPALKSYHVAGCRWVTPEMKRVSISKRPYDYAPHMCVPPEVQGWRRTK